MEMARSEPKKIGILGGTFDPVHLGHLAVARAALAGLELDEVLFIPAYKPPHKQELNQAPFAARLAMLKLALADEPCFRCSEIEGERADLSYSYDTLQELHRRFGPDVSLFFIMGHDAFVDLASWKRFRAIPRLADLVIVNRPHARPGSLARAVQDVFGVQAGVTPAGEGRWRLAAGGYVHALTMAEVPISSSAIRRALAAGDDVRRLLPSAVAAYIREHGLYCTR
ncbi:MAG: nicotinate (nicotinamide) nucleotide adenylyltransferase [Desulfobulbaceae bacterium]|nr:MAG: nicotinate (nicotinamide) nucleotide adenylyltransferase [Desulfobulbaceae bacterium]